MTKQEQHLANLRSQNDARFAKLQEIAIKWHAGSVANKLDSIRYQLASDWSYCNDALADATNDFMCNPAHYFEWAENRMIAAATRQILDSIFLASETNDLVEVLTEVLTDLSQRLLRNHDAGTSSSASHNAMAGYTREARSRMIDKLAGLLKYLA